MEFALGGDQRYYVEIFGFDFEDEVTLDSNMNY